MVNILTNYHMSGDECDDVYKKILERSVTDV